RAAGWAAWAGWTSNQVQPLWEGTPARGTRGRVSLSMALPRLVHPPQVACMAPRRGPDGTRGTYKDRAGACLQIDRLENWKPEGLNHADYPRFCTIAMKQRAR